MPTKVIHSTHSYQNAGQSTSDVTFLPICKGGHSLFFKDQNKKSLMDAKQAENE